MINQHKILRKGERLIPASLIAKHNQVLTHQIRSLNLRNQLEMIQYIQHQVEVLSPETVSTRKATPPPEPKAPVPNLAKIIADKKAERAALSSSNDSTSLSMAQKPVQQTVTVQAKQQSPQVPNTVSRYGGLRIPTQHFQSS